MVESGSIVEMVAAIVDQESYPPWIAMELLQRRDMKAASELFQHVERVLSTARNKGCGAGGWLTSGERGRQHRAGTKNPHYRSLGSARTRDVGGGSTLEGIQNEDWFMVVRGCAVAAGRRGRMWQDEL